MPSRTRQWKFLTNHGQLLLCIAEEPGLTLREIGERIGITERAAHRIVVDLDESGYLTRERNGRRNHYTVKTNRPLPDQLAKKQRVGELLAVLGGRKVAA